MNRIVFDLPTGARTVVPLTPEEIAALPPPPGPVIPASVTPRQVRLLLHSQNLLSQVETIIAASDEPTRIAWEYALEFRRNDPLLLQLAGNLNLTSEQVDQFFITAAGL
jgi:hypothetical protein